MSGKNITVLLIGVIISVDENIVTVPLTVRVYTLIVVVEIEVLLNIVLNIVDIVVTTVVDINILETLLAGPITDCEMSIEIIVVSIVSVVATVGD